MNPTFDQNPPHTPPLIDFNAVPEQKQSLFIPLSADSLKNHSAAFNQKLLHDENEGKVEIPGDIRILFEATPEKDVDRDNARSPANFHQWEKNDGNSSPGGMSQKNSAKKPPAVKTPMSFSNNVMNQPLSFNINQNPAPIKPMPIRGNYYGNAPQVDNRPGSSSPFKKGQEAEDVPFIQKFSLASLANSSQCNSFCPYCSRTVQHLENPDATYAYVINQKIYLAHAECYQSAQFNPFMPKITTSAEVAYGNLSFEPSLLNNIAFAENVSEARKAFFIKLEGIHPISSCKLFKIEKSCVDIYTTMNQNQYLYVNLDSQSSSFFEPSAYTLPFNEFKLVMSVYQTHAQEDAYVYEFNISLNGFQAKSGESKLVEFTSTSNESNNTIIVGAETIINATHENYMSKLSHKPDFYHPNLQNSLITLRYFAVPFPLKRAVPRTPVRLPAQFANQAQMTPEIPPGQLNFTLPGGGTPGNNRFKIFNVIVDKPNEFPEPAPAFIPFNQGSPTRQQTLANNSHVDNPFQKKSGVDSPALSKKGLSPTSKKHMNLHEDEGMREPPSTFSAAFGAVVSEKVENNPSLDQKLADDLEGEFKLEENIERLPHIARTYKGSKVLQEFLAKATKAELEQIVVRLANNGIELMLDPYANYMMQILAKNCSSEGRTLLLQKIAPALPKIACDKKGTYALQTLVSLINSEAEDIIMRGALRNNIIDLAMDPQGNHVIQKLINTVSLKNVDFIYQPLIENFSVIATHSSGSLVFKQLIIKVEKIQNFKATIIHIVSQEMENLVQDPYGNYVIQYVLEYYPKDCSAIQQKIISKLIPYSSQKFSSNIIEKSLAVGDFTFRKKVGGEILKNDRLADLLKNKYGNYVILHILAICDLEDKQSIMQGISKCVYSFQGTKYKLRWVKFLEENPLQINWQKGPRQFDGEEPLPEPNRQPTHEEHLKTLEVVKKIWREMNKEEKNSSSPMNGRSSYNRNSSHYEDFDGGSPFHGSESPMNYYPGGDYSFSLLANRVEKWY